MRLHCLVGAIWLAFAGPVTAANIISYNDDATVPSQLPFGSETVRPDSLLDVDGGTFALDGSTVFTGLEDIDAAHLRADGQLIFSTVTTSYIDGTAFQGGDLILYDPELDAASIFFAESNFDGGANVDAFFLFESGPDTGKFLFSTAASATIDGMTFGHGDIVLYDPSAPEGTRASIFFAESNFSGATSQKNVDAVHILPNGDLLFSVSIDGGTLAGLTLRDQDLIVWDGATASQFFDGDGLFNGTTADLDAVTQIVPEPSTGVLFAAGLIGLACSGRRHGKRGVHLRGTATTV